MEVQKVMAAAGSTDQMSALKGKRTKRQRPMSPFALTMATSTYSSAEGSGSGAGGYGDSVHSFGGGVYRLTRSPSSNSGEFTQSTIDEEDTANCLILLAQGRSKNSSEPVLAVSNKVARAEVYQCKTCNRCFLSFQALGGHRASHKKPKVTLEEKKHAVLAAGHHQENVQFNDDNTTLSLQIPSRDITNPMNKSRVHECSKCGAEFNSGQALGGHMRRHRPMLTVATNSHEDSRVVKKPKKMLPFDLNLPAPEEDIQNFPSAPKEQVIVFSASPLVDCHY